MENGNYWIDKLSLSAHPEGGYYKRTYCSAVACKLNDKNRYSASMIYFLLNKNEKSHFHRLKSDEIWIYQKGSAVEIFIIDENGAFNTKILGPNINSGEDLQLIIPANCWFAAKNKEIDTFSLMTCVVTPSFDFEDFELAKRENLIKKFPELSQIIEEFTE